MSEWLDAAAVPGAIIGGVAASVLGRPRLTQDIDVLVILERREWAAFLATGQDLGFVPRIDDALDFAESSRALLALHQPSGVAIDIVLGARFRWRTKSSVAPETSKSSASACRSRPRSRSWS